MIDIVFLAMAIELPEGLGLPCEAAGSRDRYVDRPT
jgi:hypothetical protein